MVYVTEVTLHMKDRYMKYKSVPVTRSYVSVLFSLRSVSLIILYYIILYNILNNK